MVLCFNIALIGMVIAGLACLVLGIISIIHGQKVNEKGSKNKEKIFRGVRITILGAVLVSFFAPILTKVVYQEITNGESFLEGIPFLLVFFFFPVVVLIALSFLLMFLIISVTSLQAGYEHKKEGIYDKESIILGYIMLTIGVIVVVSLIMFVIVTVREFGESIRKSYSKTSTSYNSVATLINIILTCK